MTVLILQTEDERALLNFQRNLAKNLTCRLNQTVCATSPLWIKFPKEYDYLQNELKAAAKKIFFVQIEKPDFNEKSISSRVLIVFEGKKIYGEIEFCKIISNTNDLQVEPQKNTMAIKKDEVSLALNSTSSLDFPYPLRIFRLGTAEKIDSYTNAVFESVWRKLPKNATSRQNRDPLP